MQFCSYRCCGGTAVVCNKMAMNTVNGCGWSTERSTCNETATKDCNQIYLFLFLDRLFYLFSSFLSGLKPTQPYLGTPTQNKEKRDSIDNENKDLRKNKNRSVKDQQLNLIPNQNLINNFSHQFIREYSIGVVSVSKSIEPSTTSRRQLSLRSSGVHGIISYCKLIQHYALWTGKLTYQNRNSY